MTKKIETKLDKKTVRIDKQMLNYGKGRDKVLN